MLQRCYDKNFQIKASTYIGCSVDPIWHNFQNFAEWCKINYKSNYELDKDLLNKRNKIYSPETCCFIPEQINLLISKSNSRRGEYPIGVSYFKASNKFQSGYSENGKRISLGLFNTPEEAFEKYKIAKEQYIKNIANRYKEIINDNVYLSLMNYQVEITD